MLCEVLEGLSSSDVWIQSSPLRTILTLGQSVSKYSEILRFFEFVYLLRIILLLFFIVFVLLVTHKYLKMGRKSHLNRVTFTITLLKLCYMYIYEVKYIFIYEKHVGAVVDDLHIFHC